MGPFPKWVGWLAAISAAAPTVYAGYQAGGWKGALLALWGVVTSGVVLNSHSANGTGGTASNP
jgi:hypothetical protein